MDMTKIKISLIFSIVSLLFSSQVHAANSSAGLTLTEIQGARSASLGEAFTAINNDVTGFGYNPASLSSLDRGHGTFQFQKGTFEDSYGQITVGAPTTRGGMGLSVSYYNGGTLEVLDGNQVKEVNAQTDMVASVGSSLKMSRGSIGFALKYITSELAEVAKANAYAVDLGLSLPMTSRINFGASLQNFGSKITYLQESESLPRLARTGVSVAMPSAKLPTTFMVDGVYHMNEGELRPAIGIESMIGPLALRAGYKTGSELENFSIGAGFNFGASSLDYSFGLVDTLDARHLVSFGLRFGGVPSAPLVKAPREPKIRTVKVIKERKQDNRVVVEKKYEQVPAKQTLSSLDRSGSYGSSRGVYVVREGDTLDSIAEKIYGKSSAWPRIIAANRHLIEDPERLPVGQKIILPQ